MGLFGFKERKLKREQEKARIEAEKRDAKEAAEEKALADGYYHEAVNAYEKKDYGSAMELFALSAKHGHLRGTIRIAQELHNRLHTAEDMNLALGMYELALEKLEKRGCESIETYFGLYRLYNDSMFQKHDHNKAMAMLKTAADHEVSTGTYYVGANYQMAKELTKRYSSRDPSSPVGQALKRAFSKSYRLQQGCFYIDVDKLKDDIEQYHFPVLIEMLCYMAYQGDPEGTELYFRALFTENKQTWHASMVDQCNCKGAWSRPVCHYFLARYYHKVITGTAYPKETDIEYFVYHCLALMYNEMVSIFDMKKTHATEMSQYIERIQKRTLHPSQFIKPFDEKFPEEYQFFDSKRGKR